MNRDMTLHERSDHFGYSLLLVLVALNVLVRVL